MTQADVVLWVIGARVDGSGQQIECGLRIPLLIMQHSQTVKGRDVPLVASQDLLVCRGGARHISLTMECFGRRKRIVHGGEEMNGVVWRALSGALL
jgi:hypothetical protein